MSSTGWLYEPAPYVLLRIPSLSLDDYRNLSDLTKTIMGLHGTTEPCNGVREALAVASPSFVQSLDERRQRQSSDLIRKLIRYLIRMSTRPVPFGLFAKVALVEIGKCTNLRVANLPDTHSVRPDMEWLWRFVRGLEAQIEIRRELRLRASCGAFVRGGRVMISERPALSLKSEGLGGTSIAATDAVLAALKIAKRYVPYVALIHQLTAELAAGVNQVENLIASLWRYDLIRTDLRPPFTIDKPAEYVLQRLTSISAARDAAAALERHLESVERHFRTAACQGKQSRPSAELPPPHNSDPLAQYEAPQVQVDAGVILDGRRIWEAVADDAAKAAELLLRMTAYPSGLPHITRFRQDFIRRYGCDRELPLLELLDSNFGLGVQWRAAIAHSNELELGSSEAIQDERSRILLDLASRALELTPDLLEALETWQPTPTNAPSSLDVSISVAASSAADIDAKKFQIVIGPGAGACGGGRFAGRFTGLLGHEGYRAAELIAREEEATAPNAIWAELVCVPRELRLANVVIRPGVRRYEIALDTTPAVDEDHVIRADDLVVGVRDGRFYLRWLLRDVDVRVCSGHMLAPHHLSSLGRFLAEVGYDGSPWFHMFYWGSAELLPYLPRVQVGRIVLRPEQWRLQRAEFAGSNNWRADNKFHDMLTRYRTRLEIPQHVYLGLSSERLLLDLTDPQQVAELRWALEHSHESRGIILQEVIPAIDRAWLEGPRGKYASEFIISLLRRKEQLQFTGNVSEPVASSKQAAIQPVINLQRLRPPGSEWIYLKIYCGRDFQNEILVHHLAELSKKAISAGLIEDWFFVRYADPEDHLRLRFYGHPKRLESELMPLLSAWASGLISKDLCLRFNYDSYERELERYGGPEGTAIAESIFCADSRATVSLLELLNSERGTIDRLLLAALSTHDLLSALEPSDKVRFKVYRTLAPGHDGAGEFRRYKVSLRRACQDQPISQSVGIERSAPIFARRRQEILPLAHRLTGLSRSGVLTREKSELNGSFVHLHLNRVLGQSRTTEATICGMLRRLQAGLAADKRTSQRQR
jgi:lantibiotic biosynthesis protein